MAQHFFIKKNSTLPVLKMKVVNDGRYGYKDIFDRLENAAITFSMIDTENGQHRVFNQPGLLLPVTKVACPEDEEFYIGYQFKLKDTKKVGCYKAEFKIDFLDDGASLIVPIREELFVNVVDSITNSEIVC
jgi:hypothetical protein